MTKANHKYDYREYPKPDARRSGCKVHWHYYRDRTAAEACSEAAKHNAALQEALGYDFGFQSPGSIYKIKDGERAGMWEVCLP